MLSDEITYIDHLSKKLKIKWNNELVYFPYENGDQSAIYANQRSQRIRIRGLSTQYLDGLKFTVEDITAANKLFEDLMGGSVAPRKVYIKEHSKEATGNV